MKAMLSLWTTVFMFFATAGSLALYARPASHTASKQAVEVTGCLEQGPSAKEYLLKSGDGTTWGINETDMLMNNYVGHTVTVSGDTMRPTASERADGGAQQYLRAYDIVVESGSCQK